MQETYTLEQQYPTRITATGKVMNRTLDWSRALESSRGRTTRKEAEKIRKVASEAQIDVRSGENNVLPVIAYYSTARLWLEKKDMDKNEPVQSIQYGLGASYGRDSADGRAPNLKPYSRLNGYAGALEVAISSKRLMRWFLRMELIELQNHQTVLAYQAAKDAIKNCLENCHFVYFDINYGDVIAVFSSGPMPLRLLSDGQRAMLTMVADIAYRMAVLNPHLLENVTLETPGVVLIDEIDLHLHPSWQRNVVEDLRRAFPKVQFFISSHSPFIVQSMRPGELIDLNGIPGAAEFQDKSIEDITEKSMGVEVPQRSARHQQMFEAAKEYYEALEQAKGADNAQLEELKQKLDELSAPFSDDMAYHAFLEMKRLAALGDRAE